MRILNRQAGETIVEVLISMAVLGLILSATYALANKSTQANRQSQERAEALSENDSRLEQFKTFLENDGDIPGGTFCVFENGAGELKATDSAFVGGIPQEASDDPLEIYPNQCTAGPDGRYHTAIKKESNGTYVITTRWFRVSTGEVDQLQTLYRTYPSDELVWNDQFDPSSGPIVLPPPPPPPANYVFLGREYFNCISSGEGCYTAGNGVFSCWPYSAYYGLAFNGGWADNPAPGNYYLKIEYTNGGAGHCGHTLPPPGFEYNVEITVDDNQTTDIELPAYKEVDGSLGGSRNVYIGSLGENSTIRLRWYNDYYSGTYDANFEILRLTLTKGDPAADDPDDPACQGDPDCHP